MPRFAGTDGTSVHYDVLGHDDPDGDSNGDPIITLAGGAARHPSYLGDLAGLTGLVVPHLRGVGESPAPADPEAGSYWRQAEDMEALRTHLGLDRLTVIAHSAGTRLAISYAAQYPSRLERLVLITPPAAYLVDVPSDADELIAARQGDPAFDAAVSTFRAGPNLKDQDSFNAWQHASAPVGYAAWTEVEQAHDRTGDWDLAAAQAFFSVDPPADLASRLAAVSAPTLVVAGAQDCLTGFAPVAALAELFPAGELAVIENCGHYPWVEQPAEFRRVLDKFR